MLFIVDTKQIIILCIYIILVLSYRGNGSWQISRRMGQLDIQNTFTIR